MPDSHKLSLSSLAVRGIAFEIVIKIRFNFLKYLHKLTHLDTHLVCNGLGIRTFLSLALDLMIKLGEMDKKIESVMVNVASLEKTMTNIQSEVLSLKVRANSAETKLKEMDTGLQFANAEVEDLKTQSRNNQQSIVSLKERLLYQEVYKRRENLQFFGLPESTESTIEDSSEVLYCFLGRDLDIEGACNIEFQKVHRLGRRRSSHVSLDILIRNGSLKLLWKHRMRLMLKCMQIYLRRYKKIGRSNGHGLSAQERRVKLPTLVEKSRTNYLLRNVSLLHNVLFFFSFLVGHNLVLNFI